MKTPSFHQRNANTLFASEIPNNSKNVRVGLGGQYYYSRDFNIRGDIQAGYGWKRVIELGIMGGISTGNYEYLTCYYYSCYSGPEFQADIYPYIKLGTPTDPVRFSIKPSLGLGVHLRRYHDETPERGIFLPKLDLLLDFGKPERLTLGISVYPASTPVEGFISLQIFIQRPSTSA